MMISYSAAYCVAPALDRELDRDPDGTGTETWDQDDEKSPKGRVYFVCGPRCGHRDPKVQRNLLFENCVNVLWE